MRNLAVLTFVTLDGVMQAPGDPDEDRSGGFKQGGWVGGYWDDFLGVMVATYRRTGTIRTGSFAGFADNFLVDA
jgi:hypothetical protein